MGGLSPRVRGHPFRNAAACGRHGSIPACAGSPVYPRIASGRAQVYPRVCGVTRWASPRSHSSWGLSPRVRGHQSTQWLARRWSGSIPACAGSPTGRPQAGHVGRVYPRVCGVTRVELRIPINDAGLSPRVRGHPCQSGVTKLANGSIPACAGSPSYRLRGLRCRRVYPRVCGVTTPKGADSRCS